MTDAQQLRSSMRAMRRALTQEQQQAASQAVCAHIFALEAYERARCVMAYVACRGELALERVIGDILSSGKELALPRCESPGVMTARRVERMEQLVPGAYGLMEPDERCEIIDPDQIGLILVPGTAFDRAGHRIGQGGGYYDRFLPGTRALRAGIGHDFALLAGLHAQPHDARMDCIITPSGVIWTQDDKREERI